MAKYVDSTGVYAYIISKPVVMFRVRSCGVFVVSVSYAEFSNTLICVTVGGWLPSEYSTSG